MSGVDGLFIALSGADVLELLELEEGGVPDDVVDGGVVLDDDGALGLIDELDDVEPVLGGVVDDDDDEGAGVTTGGVLELVVFDSRWQPATPRATLVQSNVTRAAFLIVISMSVKRGNAMRFSRFDATNRMFPARETPGIIVQNHGGRRSTTRMARLSDVPLPHVGRADFNRRR